MATNREWAEAIASRIADEWAPEECIGYDAHARQEDAEILEEVLVECLANSPDEMAKLIGTGIIEESYFEDLQLETNGDNKDD